LLKKLTNEELQILYDSQAEINQLEKQLNDLQIKEHQHLENKEEDDENIQLVHKPQGEENTYSSGEEKMTNTNGKYLDALARLLTGNETCVAVCLHQGRLLITSNLESPRYAEEYLEILQRFVNNQSSDNCEKP